MSGCKSQTVVAYVLDRTHNIHSKAHGQAENDINIINSCLEWAVLMKMCLYVKAYCVDEAMWTRRRDIYERQTYIDR